MYDRAMAQERIADLVRQAEDHRRARSTRAGAMVARRGAVARVKSVVLSVVLWPIRH
jgi:hypothetical protein